MAIRSSAAQQYRPAPGWRLGRTGEVLEFRQINPDRQIVLHCYPKDDPRFEVDAQAILEAGQKLALGWEKLLGQVRNRLGQLYPDVAIQPRNRLAADGDPNELWYCYRDGSLIPPTA